jgi:predicted transcriptional regulator YdeE
MFLMGLFMEPKIIKKKDFLVVGLEIQTTAKTLQSDIDQVWDKALSLDLDSEIQDRVDKNLSLAFIRNWSEVEPFSYFLGAEVEQIESVPPDCVSQKIAEATYAVFNLVGQGSNVIEPWPEITAWFESSVHEWVIPMNFREYDDATQGGRIFVPISIG